MENNIPHMIGKEVGDDAEEKKASRKVMAQSEGYEQDQDVYEEEAIDAKIEDADDDEEEKNFNMIEEDYENHESESDIDSDKF